MAPWAISIFLALARFHITTSINTRSHSKSRFEFESAKKCVKKYADNLGLVRPGLGDAIRKHSLSVVSTSDREVIIGAGSGNTGTHSVFTALKALGLEAWHSAKSKTWDNRRGEIKRILHPKNKKGKEDSQQADCHQKLRQFNYTALLDGCDAVVDMPTAEVFLSLFMSFPKARVILSTRPAESWVEGRMRTHPGVTPPLQEPCGMSMTDFSTEELGLLFTLQNDFVRCLVPKDQLLEFDLWADPDSRMTGLMKELAEFVGRSAKKAPLPHITPGNASASLAGTSATVGKRSCMKLIEDQIQQSFDFAVLRQVTSLNCDMDLDEDVDDISDDITY